MRTSLNHHSSSCSHFISRSPVNSPPLPSGAVYGVKSSKAEAAAPLINPPKLSAFEEARLKAQQPELKSTRLAREHAEKLATSGTVFGTTTRNANGTAADCIRPNVSAEDLEAEEQASKTLYVKSHRSSVALTPPLFSPICACKFALFASVWLASCASL